MHSYLQLVMGTIWLLKSSFSDQQVNPSVEGNKAILFASANDRTEVVKLLLADKRRETKV